MACCETPMIRIEKIKKNQVVNPGSSPYNQMPVSNPGSGSQNAGLLPVQDMTPVVTPDDASGSDDMTVTNPGGSGPNMVPDIIPNAPTFTVPANPLLPEGYREVLDYNSLQYVNGFFRTQIGHYVRVEQLMGSNTIENKEGYLIGVGINYILLQEMPTGNIQVIDAYGIKSMYVYYNFGNTAVPASMGTDSEPPQADED